MFRYSCSNLFRFILLSFLTYMGQWTVSCMVLPGLNADVTYNKNYLPMGRHGVYYIENFGVFACPYGTSTSDVILGS